MPVMWVKELYTCTVCGVTSEEHRHWGPICKRSGGRVCDVCCYRCDHHIAVTGAWQCSFQTPEEKKEIIRKRIQNRFDEENRRISDIYIRERKERAREWAIKQAKARAKAERQKAKRG